MIRYRKTVFIALDKLGPYKADELGAFPQQVGHFKVDVSRAKNKEGTFVGYNLTGDAVAAEVGDFGDAEEIAALNTQLATDLGRIGRVAEDDPSKADYTAGDDTCFCYVLNHGGLPLAYGEMIKDTFAKRSGRVTAAAAVDSFADACAWCQGQGMELVFTQAGIAEIKAKYAARTV